MLLPIETRFHNLRKENGVVYTPRSLATYVARKVTELYLKDLNDSSLGISSLSNQLKNLKIIDPACGEGELLSSIWGALLNALGNRGEDMDAKSILCGIDIDQQALVKTAHNISDLQTSFSKSNHNVILANALFPENIKLGIKGWDSVKKFFKAVDGFDILIANPPWGADTNTYREQLFDSNFLLHKGQYDTSDLFVELALSVVKTGGYFAFIIPDSIFGFERKDLRKLLLEQTEIKFIGRLGEKIFEGVNRACAVVICKKIQPKLDTVVSCLRLDPLTRKNILSGETSFLEADQLLTHPVKQVRFLNNDELLFDIDTKEEEVAVLNKITNSGEIIGQYVSSARGVELSKTGKICRCESCGYWTPLPATPKSKCSHCSAIIDLSKAKARTIISKKRFKGSRPILVGESVKRYSISSRYWISVGSKGINYKNISLYYEPKILVRKTGVGITATIDYSRALTNQVVYIFRSILGATKVIPIEFILAVMNSRVLYYYLIKKYGETEWRSHPYLTQSQILNLPLPDLDTKIASLLQNKIVKLLKPYLEKRLSIPKTVDAKVEYYIASMFGLSKTDYKLIYKTIDSTQGLIPVKELCAVNVLDIFK